MNKIFSTVCKLSSYINPDIKVGDIVKIVDGSGFSIDCNPRNVPHDVYIIYSYPELTGSDVTIKSMEGIVTEVDIKDRCIKGHSDTAMYLQDIRVQFGKASFLTCSKFVRAVGVIGIVKDYRELLNLNSELEE